MLRLFAAVAVPWETARALRPLMTGLDGARWHPDEALHITVRFFGDLDERRAEDLAVELGRIAMPAFDLAPVGVGAFGDDHRARSLWVGLRPSEALERLHGKCETAARRAGLAPEGRAYRPHVTLAYLTGQDARIGLWQATHADLRLPAFRVDRFGLYSSHAGHAHPLYRLEADYRLG